MPDSPDAALCVAVTGPTGTLGYGLMPLLEDDDRIARVVGVARRPFDPAVHGWAKMRYRRGDVRDQTALAEAFAGADVVVHLAFLVAGTASRATTASVNVEGTLTALRAAAAAGARRFVYASSVAAYGFHADNPEPLTEDWPARPAEHFFYAQEKAELERLLADEVARHPGPGLYLLRPSIVLGPHTLGAKLTVPRPLTPLLPLARRLGGLAARVDRLPVGLPVPAPALPVQFVHEDDVGRALLACIVGAGPPGAYNIAGDGVLTVADVARELGLTPVPVPPGLVRAVARSVAALPAVPQVVTWAEALTHPAVMDTAKAKRDLGWRPRYTGREALRAALGR
ncbi:MAG TPA: NAD-dependent epimerase/dehydratase family protein [Acidimicrobiales bacterium]|nr:NAD-dependent epimerase/dehydratase family protein [Acidimicrobiales bacterium]